MLGKTFRCAASLAVSALLFGGVSVADDADVNQRKADGSTPLQWAVYDDDVAEVRRLIKAGADVKLANNYGATPMSI
ncbi:MAG TPA: ankyrin repeat domain-containing protein, partial [Rhodanobacteraceae bacterium]|nr:ankyrin repeat domain-containing protein [Rhodanobacteraceae bacterium]